MDRLTQVGILNPSSVRTSGGIDRTDDSGGVPDAGSPGSPTAGFPQNSEAMTIARRT